MKQWMAFTVSLLVLALTAGCPFVAEVPLGEPGGLPLDERLNGLWVATDDGGDSLQILIMPFNSAEYYIELWEQAGEPSRFRAFPIDLGGEPVLHINELTTDPAPAEYSFARYTISDDHAVTLRMIGDKIVPKDLAAEPQSLAAFLREHLNDPALDDEDTRLVLRPEGSR